MGVFTLFTAHFNARLTYTTCLIALSSANYGFDNQGFSAAQAMQPFAKQFGYYSTNKGNYQLQAYWLALYSSLIWIGFAVGLFLGSFVSARFGRRKGMIGLATWSILSATIIVSSFNKWQLLAGRILFNIYLGMELAVLPVYQAEIVPQQVRGLTVGAYQLSIQIGGLIMNCIALGTSKIPNNKSWRILFGLFYIVPCLILSGIYWAPESPRWLLRQGMKEDARRSLTLLRKGKRDIAEIDEEILSIEIALREEPEQGRFLEIFNRDNIKRTGIAIGINFFQELSGQQITSRFGALIVADIGGIDPFYITVTFALVNIATVWFVMVTTDKFGRRSYLLISIAGMGLFEIGLGVLGLYDYTTNHAIASTAIFFLVMMSLMFSLGYAPLTNVVMTEVVSLRLRDLTQRVAGQGRVVSNFLVGFTLPYEIDDIGLKLGFIYGGFCALAFIFTWFCVPECKGKNLEVIEHMFQTGVPIRKFGSYRGDVDNLTEEIVAQDKGDAAHEGSTTSEVQKDEIYTK